MTTTHPPCPPNNNRYHEAVSASGSTVLTAVREVADGVGQLQLLGEGGGGGGGNGIVPGSRIMIGGGGGGIGGIGGGDGGSSSSSSDDEHDKSYRPYPQQSAAALGSLASEEAMRKHANVAIIRRDLPVLLPSVRLLIGILSSPKNVDRRQEVRR